MEFGSQGSSSTETTRESEPATLRDSAEDSAEDGPRAPFPSGPLTAVVLAVVALPLAIRDGPRPWIEDPWPTLAVLVGIGLFLFTALVPSRRIGLLLHTSLGLGLALGPAGGDVNGRSLSLLLFFPLWLALFLSRDRQPFTRRIFGLLALVSGIRLLSLGSRGALLAALLAGAAVVAVRMEKPRRAALWASSALALLAIALLVGVPGAVRLPVDPLVTGNGIVDGEAEGASVENLLSGRPTIWQSSLLALADVPLTGLGPNRFAEVVPAYYPGSVHRPMPAVDDAHQLFLQVALDLGTLGLLGLCWMLLIAFGRLRALWQASRPGGRLRYWTAGLGAALSAHVACGLVEAVSLGTASSWGLWTLLGLVLGTRAPTRCRWPRWLEHPRPAVGLLALAAVGTAVGVLAVASGLWRADSADRQALWALRADEVEGLAEAAEALDTSAEDHPGSLWLRGLVADALGFADARDRAFDALLEDSPARITLVEAHLGARSVAPERQRILAQAVVERWPSAGTGWLWLARCQLPPKGHRGGHRGQGEGDPDAAVRLFRQGLALRPSDGPAWLELGDLLSRMGELQAALEAYAEACEQGDPGANGCLRAGSTAEHLGLDQRAKELYGRSRWPPVRQRAEP